VPVALALSGGIDSACIAVELRAEGPAVPGYQARAVGEDGGERARARAVAAQLGLELREVDVDATALRALPALTAAHGLPLGDPSVLAVHALAQRAAADGVRVLLSGEGADELLLGYPRHRLAARLPRHGLGGLPAPGLRTSRLARAWRALASPDPYDALLEVAPPGFRRRALTLPDAELCGPLRAARPQLAACSTLALARHADRVAYLREDLLPKLDVATMAAGVEGRCPFLDPEVLGCREAVTEDLRALLGKRPLRARYAAALPPGHFDQHKRGFAVPLDRWWREDEFLPDLLLERRSLERPHLRPGGVRWLLDRHRAGRARLGHALYLLVAHELHLRSLEDPA
jgi:asparagine synthase (glutamine-hydrolysing)